MVFEMGSIWFVFLELCSCTAWDSGGHSSNLGYLLISDVISIDKTGENFRLIYDTKGRFAVHRITPEEAKVSVASRLGFHAVILLGFKLESEVSPWAGPLG